MYNEIREDTLFIILYTVVMAMAILASCYLLLRRGNAFAAHITTPVRLRRFTAAFFAALAVNHLWYMPIFFHISSKEVMMIDLTGGLLDCMTLFPLAIIVLLSMLQDRRRKLWPVAVIMAPLIVIGVLSAATYSYALLPIVYAYSLLMCFGLIIYMVRALRQYGGWLRDNYADLEHKEVWQSFLVLAIIMLVFGVYVLTSQGPLYQYSMQIVIALLIGYLLWRVETLSDLSTREVEDDGAYQSSDGEYQSPETEKWNQPGGDIRAHSARRFCRREADSRKSSEIEGHGECLSTEGPSQVTHEHIAQLLQQHCIDTQLYLQHDLSLTELAKAIGTNRAYLTTYFAQEGIKYNIYINDLRIQHFVRLYREAVDAQRPFTVRQLASESGYRSYSTFGLAFKQRMGQTVTAWMHDTAK